MLTESPFDVRAAEYDGWYEKAPGKLIFTSEVKAFQEVLPSLPKPWIEIGVGSGRFAQALGIVTGIDPAGRLLEIARSRGIITLQGKIEDHFLPEESFGTAFLITTQCFLENPLTALKEIHCVLKRDGRLALGMIPADSSWGTYYRQKKQLGHPFYKHADFYTYDQVTSLLNKAGFSIVTTISTLQQKPGEVVTVEPPLPAYKKEAGFLVIIATKLNTPV